MLESYKYVNSYSDRDDCVWLLLLFGELAKTSIFTVVFLQMNAMRLLVGFHAWMVPVIFTIRDVIKSDSALTAKMKWDVSQLFSLQILFNLFY